MNNMEIKNFLHFYLGCDCMMTKNSYHAVHELNLSRKHSFRLSGRLLSYFIQPTTKAQIKPILKKLDAVSEEDCLFIADLVYSKSVPKLERAEIGRNFVDYDLLGKGLNHYDADKLKEFSTLGHFEIFKYLLSKHFDLFNLIESGLAIDKNEEAKESLKQEG